MDREITVQFINSFGEGYAKSYRVDDDTTVGDFLAERLPGRDANTMVIRLNAADTTPNIVLRDGDKLSASPVAPKGA